MIYESPAVDDPIRQGDVFFGLPRVDISLARLAVVADDASQIHGSWEDIVKRGEPVNVILSVLPVIGIVISQDCDAARQTYISLCEIRDFREIYTTSAQTRSAKKWGDIITQHSRRNQKWFYLPVDTEIGFHQKMGVDFFAVLRVRRTDLEEHRHLRKARLNEVAEAHFRERIAEFFRRYPYDEWYPLDSEEMAAYQQQYPEAEPYPWQ